VSSNTEPLAWTWDEAKAESKVGETKLREAIRDGELAVMRVGDRVLFEPAEIRRWLRSKRTRAGQPVVEPDTPGDLPAVEIRPAT
jgi:hypothetical protein